MDTQQLITLILGILTVIVIFQTRIGKIFAGLKYDIQSMEVRLSNRIDEVNSNIQAVETRLNTRIDEVKIDLKEDIHTVKTDLKQDIHNAEVRLNGNETESNLDERAEAEAV